MTTPALYMSVGRELTHYAVDIAGAALERRESTALPSNVQYVWPHPHAAVLYAACSNGGPEASGASHFAVALRVDDAGAVIDQGTSVPLPSRPIHATVDPSGRYLLTAYNKPSALTVHRIESDGSIGAEVKQRSEPETGIYAHQVKCSPSGDTVVVVARGNFPSETKPEEPGALKVFSFADGQLTALPTVAPNGGYGFGPRHLDFHPSRPWVYVSLERQNLLHMFRMGDGGIELEPAFVKETLADTAALKRRQRPGTIHVHPNGRYVYVANRASGTDTVDGEALFIGGENNIAVFRIDERSGEPVAIQHEDTRGIVPRTFALDAGGRLLVAANSVPIRERRGGAVTTVLPSLSVFRVGDDGKLAYARKYEIDTGDDTLFWMGIVG